MIGVVVANGQAHLMESFGKNASNAAFVSVTRMEFVAKSKTPAYYFRQLLLLVNVVVAEQDQDQSLAGVDYE
jgi:hypothetical protein